VSPLGHFSRQPFNSMLNILPLKGLGGPRWQHPFAFIA